jgi:hypothetical protein
MTDGTLFQSDVPFEDTDDVCEVSGGGDKSSFQSQSNGMATFSPSPSPLPSPFPSLPVNPPSLLG